jgi:hypothetical protein
MRLQDGMFQIILEWLLLLFIIIKNFIVTIIHQSPNSYHFKALKSLKYLPLSYIHFITQKYSTKLPTLYIPLNFLYTI